MVIEILKSKIHKVKVTEADLNYVGSIAILDINNGERFETYIIKAPRGSGEICLNGPAARKVQVGDAVLVVSYASMDFEEAKTFEPSVIFPKEGNRL